MTATKFLTALAATFITLLVLGCTAGSASAAVYEEGPCKLVPRCSTDRAHHGRALRCAACDVHHCLRAVTPERP